MGETMVVLGLRRKTSGIRWLLRGIELRKEG
jgi:hypothetical protein